MRREKVREEGKYCIKWPVLSWGHGQLGRELVEAMKNDTNLAKRMTVTSAEWQKISVANPIHVGFRPFIEWKDGDYR